MGSMEREGKIEFFGRNKKLDPDVIVLSLSSTYPILTMTPGSGGDVVVKLKAFRVRG